MDDERLGEQRLDEPSGVEELLEETRCASPMASLPTAEQPKK